MPGFTIDDIYEEIKPDLPPRNHTSQPTTPKDKTDKKKKTALGQGADKVKATLPPVANRRPVELPAEVQTSPDQGSGQPSKLPKAKKDRHRLEKQNTGSGSSKQTYEQINGPTTDSIYSDPYEEHS